MYIVMLDGPFKGISRDVAPEIAQEAIRLGRGYDPYREKAPPTVKIATEIQTAASPAPTILERAKQAIAKKKSKKNNRGKKA